MLADAPHGRGLTSSERSRLDDLERRLAEGDPALAATLRDGSQEAGPPGPWRILGIAVAVAVAVLLAGLAGGLGGAATLGVTLLAWCWAWQMVRRHRADRS